MGVEAARGGLETRDRLLPEEVVVANRGPDMVAVAVVVVVRGAGNSGADVEGTGDRVGGEGTGLECDEGGSEEDEGLEDAKISEGNACCCCWSNGPGTTIPWTWGNPW